MNRSTMGWTRRHRRVVRPHLLTLVLAPMLAIVTALSGCGGPASSVFNQAPPLLSDTVIAYITGSNYATPASVVGLRARDGMQVWRTEIGLNGNRSVSVVGGALYSEGGSTLPTASQPGTDGVVALRLRDGTPLWRVRLPGMNYNGGVDVSADETTVLVAAGKVGLFALNPADGSIRWRKDGTISGPPRIGSGVVIVALASDPATGTLHGGLTAFRESDGAALWQTTLGSVAATNQTALYGNYGVNLSFARSLGDGHELWEYEAGRVVEGSATSFSGAIIEASDHLALVQMAMRKNDVETDTLVALDAQTGKVRWQSAPGFDGAAIFASPSAAETTIYGPHKSTLVALRSGNGTQLWQADFSHYAGLNNMIVAGGVLFALFEPSCRYSPCLGETTVPRLMALDGATGATYWERDLPDALYLAPTL